MQLEQTAMGDRDQRTLPSLQKVINKREAKFRRARKEKHEVRTQHTQQQQQPRAKSTGASRPRVRRGRFPVPLKYLKEMPDGCPPPWKEQSECGRGMRFSEFPIRLFVDHFEELDALVRRELPVRNQTPERRFAVRMALQNWPKGKLIEIEQAELQRKVGAFATMSFHSCRACSGKEP